MGHDGFFFPTRVLFTASFVPPLKLKELVLYKIVSIFNADNFLKKVFTTTVQAALQGTSEMRTSHSILALCLYLGLVLAHNGKLSWPKQLIGHFLNMIQVYTLT